uniref:Uncharacterized protein n=1 Tax=Arundo donax TaxID=35708 RepID=A0A0A9CE79_ARUDO
MRRVWDKWKGPDGRVIPRDRILIYCTCVISHTLLPVAHPVTPSECLNSAKIFCRKHDIIKKLRTPKRNHIIFPDAKKVRVPRILEGPPMEEDTPEEEDLLDHPSTEPSQPAPAARDQNQCLCSSPIDSFARESLFMNPHPGNFGWLSG